MMEHVETEERLGDEFVGKRFAQNLIEVVIDKSDKNYFSIVAGATDESHELHIPYSHRLVALLIYHTDASDAVSELKMNVGFIRAVGQNFPKGFKEELFIEDDIVDPTVCENYGVGFERPASIYTLTLQTTINHRIYFVLYIQKLRKE